jgi:protein gp37
MGANTEISWTQATFNPWWGCAKISPGCDHCYAEEIARRFHSGIWGPNSARRVFDDPKHFREPLGWNRKAEAAGKPLRVFCGSMCDVFEKHPVAEEYRPELFTLIHKTPWLRWQLLTKRVGNVARMVPTSWMNGHWPRNAWIGATVVNQEEADRDVPKLLLLPAPVRFLSCEPLLGPLDLDHIPDGNPAPAGNGMFFSALSGEYTGYPANCEAPLPYPNKIHWVIAGGESGRSARPMHPDWARSLRDQCAAAGTPFHFKQWGEFLPADADEADPAVPDVPESRLFWSDGSKWDRFDGQRGGVSLMARVGKKAAGRLLDGREHNEFPAVLT